jgi:multiple sugar transport system permease protein
MFLFAISPKDAAFSGQLWPTNPTLRNFEIVFGQKHHFLYHFWLQMWNSLAISCATGGADADDRLRRRLRHLALRMKGGRLVMNLALLHLLHSRPPSWPCRCTRPWACTGLLNNDWALILAMVTVASPYAIWILRQASDKLPVELDEAALIDGASPFQLFRLVYIR